MRKALQVIISLLLFAPVPNARASTITLDVSASLRPYPGKTCIGSGCTLSGTLVLDNTVGTFLMSDISISGESPSIGPFTNILFGGQQGIAYFLIILDTSGANRLQLEIIIPTLVGFTGGPLYAGGSDISSNAFHTGEYLMTSGSLSPAATPEPGTISLYLTGFACLGFMLMRRRNSPNGQCA